MESKIDQILLNSNKQNEDLSQIKIDLATIKVSTNKNTENINKLAEKVTKQEEVIDRLEKIVKRKNIIIFGNPEKEDNKTDLELSVLMLFCDTLKVNCKISDIDFIHRLGKKEINKVRPIRVTFTTLKLRNEIYSNRFKLKGLNIFINEDLTTNDEEKRKQMVKEMKIHKEAGKLVKLVKNKLVFMDESLRKRERHSSDDTSTENAQMKKAAKTDAPASHPKANQLKTNSFFETAGSTSKTS